MTLTVSKLKKLILDLPDETIVVRPGFDHSFLKVGATIQTIVEEPHEGSGDFTENHPSVEGHRLMALVID